MVGLKLVLANLETRLVSGLGTFIVITNSDGTLAFTKAVGPETLDRRRSTGNR